MVLISQWALGAWKDLMSSHSHDGVQAGVTTVALPTQPFHFASEKTQGSEGESDLPKSTQSVSGRAPAGPQDPRSLTPRLGFLHLLPTLSKVMVRMSHPCQRSPGESTGSRT